MFLLSHIYMKTQAFNSNSDPINQAIKSFQVTIKLDLRHLALCRKLAESDQTSLAVPRDHKRGYLSHYVGCI